MKLIGRASAWLVALVATTIVALNIERVAKAHKLDQLVPDAAPSNAILAFVERPAVLVIATFVLGLLIGLAALKVRSFLSRNTKPPHSKERALGVRMLHLTHQISQLQRWSRSAQDQRNAMASLDMVMIDAERMGLPVPDHDADPEVTLTYLTDIGGWLLKGDFTTALLRAHHLAGQADEEGEST
ncbi:MULTISPECIES: hypothetical protein [unclassified Brevundimonas]|jgi:hypothetical protein|uniref:hypothetical protein n=1 Tax=unclassified Brevundimonas TaxID=2622653 RepID=UPI000C48D059|nr:MULTISPECIES: hypothetical protein [unclassified Brevundimonas]MAL87533.1 hypothetical protein [Brevundimonas sp.]HAV49730.1 hypothetical protein [Brevundimonas sp.]|tara:strand:+ start:20318 stop:20872 length:555 start_codon:yes stop_codon:yes gene_type:complete